MSRVTCEGPGENKQTNTDSDKLFPLLSRSGRAVEKMGDLAVLLKCSNVLS